MVLVKGIIQCFNSVFNWIICWVKNKTVQLRWNDRRLLLALVSKRRCDMNPSAEMAALARSRTRRSFTLGLGHVCTLTCQATATPVSGQQMAAKCERGRDRPWETVRSNMLPTLVKYGSQWQQSSHETIRPRMKYGWGCCGHLQPDFLKTLHVQ